MNDAFIFDSSETSPSLTQRPSTAEVKNAVGRDTRSPYALIARTETTIQVPYRLTYCHVSVVRTSFVRKTVPHTEEVYIFGSAFVYYVPEF